MRPSAADNWRCSIMKALRWLPVIVGGVLLAKHFGPKMGGMCERMAGMCEQVFEKMPEQFPPK